MSEADESLVLAEEPAVAVPSVGEQLAAARQARGLEIADVSQALKLGPRQVEALENGDWHALPGQTFIRGFVRNYARLLGMDAGPLMAMLDEVLEKPAGSLVVPPSHQGSMPHAGGPGIKRDRAVMITGGALVILAALAYFLVPGDLSSLRDNAQGLLDSLARKEEPAPVATMVEPVFPPGATPQQIMNPQAVLPAVDEPAAVEAKAAAVSEPSAAPATPSSAVAASGTGQMRAVFDKESWLEVRDRDNRLVFSQRLAAGTEQTLAGAAPLSLVIGYAPGVRLFWQGKSIDLAPHTKGDVARLVLE
jgi:cytoskeleton protein RodZ